MFAEDLTGHDGGVRGAEELLPTGVVTFLLTDVVGSTALWGRDPAAAESVARQRRLIADAVDAHGGVRPVEQGEGDSVVAVFTRASDALAAALEAQCAIVSEAWPGMPVEVRMAVHTGEAELLDDRTYGGTAIARCARLRDLAQGRQVLVSGATAAVAAERLPPGTGVVEVGIVALRGLDRPERVHVLAHPRLEVGFSTATRSARLGGWPTSLVGRAAERAEIAEAIATSPVVTITGTGGAGKSRLAHAVASDLLDRFDEVVWVELAEVPNADDVAAAIARECGVAQARGLPTAELVAEFLSDKSYLLVLDNCEHVLDSTAAVVAAIVRAAPAVRLLATSREPLAVRGETSWRIPSLSTPPGGTLATDLAQYDAATLFVERATAADPTLTVDDSTAPLIAAICRRLDGLPLALELAAARVRSMALSAIAAGLDDRFRLLTGGDRTALARQQTLLASVEWSHDLLDDDERIVLRRLCIFRGAFTVEAVEAVTTDDDLDGVAAFEALTRLVDKSLVQTAGPRYRLLETIRQFAADRAATSAELESLRDRHLAWFRRRASSWRLDVDVLDEPTMDQISAESPDLLAAFEWSSRDDEPAIELLWPLGHRWLRDSAFDELARTASTVLNRFERGSRAWLEALAPLASALSLGGDRRWVEPALEALTDRGEDVPDTTRAHLLWASASGPTMVGGPGTLHTVRDAVELGRRTGTAAVELGASAMLSHALAAGGAVDEAGPLCDWLHQRLPPDACLRSTLDITRGHLALHRCDFGEAWSHVADHVTQRPPNLRAVVVAGLVGVYQENLSRLDVARDALRWTSSAGAYELWRAQLDAYAAVFAGDLERARAEVDAYEPADGSEYQHLVAGRLRIHLALSVDDVEAAATLAAGLVVAPDHLSGYGAATIDLTLADVAIYEGAYRDAEDHVHRALNRIHPGLGIVTVDALEMLAVLLLNRQRPSDAAKLLAATQSFRQRTGLRWRLPHRRLRVERALADLVASSGPDELVPSLEDAVRVALGSRGRRGRPAFGWDSLTPTEVRVVRLVAEGLTNQAIAANLFIGVATVKTHLVHIYEKLGVRSRTELVAAAARRG